MSSYRVIYFSPHPGRGWQVPVAALADDASKGATVVLAHRTPGADCSGGIAAQLLLERGTQLLSRSSGLSAERLPPALTDHFTLGAQLEAPKAVTDVAAWLRSKVLPRRGIRTQKRESFKRRKTVGRAFLRTREVADYVADDFDIADYLPALRQFHGEGKASQWVHTRDDRVLLLEPISSGLDVGKQVSTVMGRYSVILQLARRANSENRFVPISYVVSPAGHDPNSLRKQTSRLSYFSRVFDTADPEEASAFVGLIRTEGTEVSGQDRLRS